MGLSCGVLEGKEYQAVRGGELGGDAGWELAGGEGVTAPGEGREIPAAFGCLAYAEREVRALIGVDCGGWEHRCEKGGVLWDGALWLVIQDRVS